MYMEVGLMDKIVSTYAIFHPFEPLFWVLKRTVSIETALLSIKKIVFG